MFYAHHSRQAVATQALIRASERSAKHYQYLGLTRASECLYGLPLEAYCQLHQQRQLLLHGIY